MNYSKASQIICNEFDNLYVLTKRLYIYAPESLRGLVTEFQRQLFVKCQKVLQAITDNRGGGGA